MCIYFYRFIYGTWPIALPSNGRIEDSHMAVGMGGTTIGAGGDISPPLLKGAGVRGDKKFKQINFFWKFMPILNSTLRIKLFN